MYQDFFTIFPSKLDPDYNRKIIERKEFNEFISEKKGVLPNKLLWYQEMAIRYFGPHTPINRGIINGDPGIGKTWAALGLVKQYIEWNSNMKHPIVLVKNETGAEIFKKLNKVFFPGKSHVSKATNVVKGNNISETKQMPFRIMRYGKFVKNFQNKDDTFFEVFGKRLIVCDEIHNLRKLENTEKQLFKNIKHIFSKLKDSIIIGLTATLMVDRAEEFASIFNIIMGKDVIDENILKTSLLNQQHVHDYLEPLIRGSIIHIPKKDGIKNITTVGEYDPNLSSYVTKVKISNYHQELMKTKRETRIKYIFANPFVVTLTVNNVNSITILDTSIEMVKDPFAKLTQSVVDRYGENITLYINNQLIIQNENTVLISVTFKKAKSEDLYSKTKEGKILYYQYTNSFLKNIDNVKKVSKVFHKTLKIVNMDKYKDSIIFIYLPYLEYGINILQKIFELNGFVYYSGKETIKFDMNSTVKRFSIISGSTKPNELVNIMLKLNMDHNSTGKIIKIVIGTDVTKESINFRNAQVVIKIIPTWNMSTSIQVDQRVNRVDSQLKIPEKDRFIDVWNLVAVTDHGESFIEKTIKSSIEKQKRIQLIENVIKSTSFTSYYFINQFDIKPKFFVSYFKHYFDKEPVIKMLKQHFLLNGVLSIDEIKKKFINHELITMTLNEMSKSQMLIPNQFGKLNFIAKKNNSYFLSSFKNYNDSQYSNMVATIKKSPINQNVQLDLDYDNFDTAFEFMKNKMFEQSFFDNRPDIYNRYPNCYRFYKECEIAISTFTSTPRIVYYNQYNKQWRDMNEQEKSIFFS